MRDNTLPILITGINGQVGGAFAALSTTQSLPVLTPGRDKLDLSNPASIKEYFSVHKVSAVVNCAAYTAVDKAESDEAVAIAVNAIAPALIGQIAAESRIPVLHVSTDYVFDGTKRQPYHEDDTINPLSVYGRTKAAGEQALARSGAQYAIIRTSWVQRAVGVNFLNTMLRLALEREHLNIVDDQTGSPTSADDIAKALMTILHGIENKSGVWNFTNSGTTTWYGFAKFIFAFARDHGMKIPKVEAISTAQYPTPATRPYYSVLNCSKYTKDFGESPRAWQIAINEILTERLKKVI